jgi:hypothetical protein
MTARSLHIRISVKGYSTHKDGNTYTTPQKNKDTYTQHTLEDMAQMYCIQYNTLLKQAQTGRGTHKHMSSIYYRNI